MHRGNLLLCALLLTGCGECSAYPAADTEMLTEQVTEQIAQMLADTRQIARIELPEHAAADPAACICSARQGFAGTLLKAVHWQRHDGILMLSAVYADTPESVRRMKRQLCAEISGRAEELAQFPPPVQILLLHDTLISECEYCAEAPFSDSAYGAANGYAACGGYAEYLMLAADACGIPAYTVTGSLRQGGVLCSHAWNLVQLDGAWYHLDCICDEGTVPSHAYFLRTDTEMLHDHVWDTQAYPPADGDAYRYETIMQHFMIP